jgi:hypothetical protein
MTRRTRFWIESALAGVSTFLLVLTIFTREWIEAFGVDPDHGSGSAEWAITAVVAVLAVVFSVLARADWRRMHPRTA